jgi:D-serine deaminase-like pyridoxal phosphate-dependent protein
VKLSELTTPALVVEAAALDANLRTMADALPGGQLRPHVKAHKCTALAARQAALGNTAFTCATIREMEGMAEAGLGEDLLLANEVVDASRLGALARRGARVTLAVDSEVTIDAAVQGGVAEGHIVGLESRATREEMIEVSMGQLVRAHEDVGGDVISGGGTGTYDMNRWVTEIQAGSYALMDTAYAKLGLPFVHALSVLSTVISVSKSWVVADCGLKALGMDHGNPSVEGAEVWFCSDEHLTMAPSKPMRVGDRVRVLPAHIDPTVAYHEHLHIVDGDDVVDRWDVDLRGW